MYLHFEWLDNSLPSSTINMNFFARARTGFMSWMHETPLPSTEAYPKFQSWHHFDPVQQWVSWDPTRLNNTTPRSTNTENIPKLVLLTWNIDATSSQTQARVTEIITFITDLDPKVEVIFLQEVSKTALQQLLGDARIRGSWLSSECDDTAWGKQSFATVTLVSKARFASNAESGENAILGPIWRVKYPSHFDRDALCCDIFVPSPTKPESESKLSSATRIRLINVHLDSLPIQPSHRPRQISIISSFLRAAGYGIVAGDFNPVLDEDATLIENSGLTDVWTSLRSEELGYTWGVDGEQPFPPNRLDKVAVLGLTPYSIQTLQPGRLSNLDSKSQQAGPSEDVPWSDHHALLCSLSLPAK
jgi:tyrosyl-DNA phosphodiesterase 2